MTVEEYRQIDAIHYSLLSKVANISGRLDAQEKPVGDGIIFGSLFDDMLTNEDFDINNSRYIIVESRKPDSEMMQKYCNTYIETQNPDEAYAQSGYKASHDSVKEKFKEFEEYCSLLIQARDEDKYIITNQDFLDAQTGCSTLLSHSFTSWYFDKEDGKKEILFQKPVVYDLFNGYQGKALFDLIVIDHIKKAIYPVDIKTMSDSVYSFEYGNYRRFKYYLQGSWYTRSIKHIPYISELLDSHYTLENFRFMVLSRDNLKFPLIYEMSQNDIFIGEYGGFKDGKKYKGYHELTDDYIWHKTRDLWEYPRDIYESNGVKPLNFFGEA